MLTTLLLTLTLAWGCDASPAAIYGAKEIVVLEVAPERASCQGEMADRCLQVRRPGEEEWRNFFDPIEGFDYQEGFFYTIEVARREVLNPPADGSAYVYRLIEVLEKVPAEG